LSEGITTPIPGMKLKRDSDTLAPGTLVNEAPSSTERKIRPPSPAIHSAPVSSFTTPKRQALASVGTTVKLTPPSRDTATCPYSPATQSSSPLR
jgi:hypothetical protein